MTRSQERHLTSVIQDAVRAEFEAQQRAEQETIQQKVHSVLMEMAGLPPQEKADQAKIIGVSNAYLGYSERIVARLRNTYELIIAINLAAVTIAVVLILCK